MHEVTIAPSVQLDRLLTAKQVADLLGISARTLKRLAQLGHVPAPDVSIRGIGRRVMPRWKRSTVEQFIDDGGEVRGSER